MRCGISTGAMQRRRLKRHFSHSLAAITAAVLGSWPSPPLTTSCPGIAPVPNFEIQKGPKQLFAVLSATHVVSEYGVEHFRLVVRARDRGSALQMISQKLAHGA